MRNISKIIGSILLSAVFSMSCVNVVKAMEEESERQETSCFRRFKPSCSFVEKVAHGVCIGGVVVSAAVLYKLVVYFRQLEKNRDNFYTAGFSYLPYQDLADLSILGILGFSTAELALLLKYCGICGQCRRLFEAIESMSQNDKKGD